MTLKVSGKIHFLLDFNECGLVGKVSKVAFTKKYCRKENYKAMWDIKLERIARVGKMTLNVTFLKRARRDIFFQNKSFLSRTRFWREITCVNTFHLNIIQAPRAYAGFTLRIITKNVRSSISILQHYIRFMYRNDQLWQAGWQC